jgi:hypothetical protein
MAVAAEPASVVGTPVVSCHLLQRAFGPWYAAFVIHRHPDQPPAPCTALRIPPLSAGRLPIKHTPSATALA